MKITISVPGRFHAFSLAKYLNDQDCLHCIVTSYPKFEVKKYGIPGNKIKTIVSKEILYRASRKILGTYMNTVLLNNWFDRIAYLKMPKDSDIYVIWAGFGAYSFRKLRKKNPDAIFILERGSAHIESQNELLSIFNKDKSSIDAGTIEKEKVEYELANYIAVPSLFARKTFIQKGIDPNKLFVNNYGVDLSLFKPSRNRPANHLFTVGYAGNISNQKNVLGIIRACQQLIEKKYQLRLLIAGEIDLNSYRNEDILVGDWVDYRGVLPETELPGLYEQMDVFVLNSIQDGFGMVLLQAMAMGVPVIATTNTGGPDVIKEGVNGFLIDILDDTSLSNCLEMLILNPELKAQMGESAQLASQGGFSWEDYGERAISFYRMLCKGRSSWL